MPIVKLRNFRVHARHVDRHHARLVTETSFEAAAVAYLDDYPQMPDDEPAVSIVVHELATGHEHCFRVDFDTGEMASCG
jgi:Family of unknown function (DUF5961)